MPQQVIKTVKAQQLQVGDVILPANQNEPELTVTDRPVVKVKYVYVGYSAKGIVGQVPFEKDAEVSVRREEATPDELAARTREQAITWATEARDRVAANLTSESHKLIENLPIKDGTWHGRYWLGYTEAQLELSLWDYVFDIAEARDIDVYEALLLVREDLIRRVIDLGSFLPSSTSALHNLVKSVENEVRIRFIRDIGWHV